MAECHLLKFEIAHFLPLRVGRAIQFSVFSSRFLFLREIEIGLRLVASVHFRAERMSIGALRQAALFLGLCISEEIFRYQGVLFAADDVRQVSDLLSHVALKFSIL